MVEVIGLILFVMTLFGIYGLLSLSLNLEAGFAGQLNLGLVMSYAIGAFVAGWLSINFISLFAHFPNGFFSPDADSIRVGLGAVNATMDLSVFVLSLLLGAGIAGLFGYLVAIPTSRTAQAYLAIVMLASAEVTKVVGVTYVPLVGGVQGILGIPGPFDWMSNFFTRQVLYAIISLSLLAAVYFGIERLTNSPYGRLLKSIREDELASQGIGKKTYKAKRNVMALGSAIGGIAGVLLIFYLGTVQPAQFTLSVTGLIFTMVLLGGIGNNRGVLAGTIALTGSDVGFTVLEGSPISAYVPFSMGYIHQILVGVLLILIFAVRAQGLFPEKRVDTPAWRFLRSESREPT